MEAAEAKSDELNLSRRVAVFRVRVRDLPMDRIYAGREDEDEYLIQGRIEGVVISDSEAEDEGEDEEKDAI